jgi:prepilin-type N-terminal cleavage/methylation domain-containing protein
MRRDGFTLAELLISIAILAILSVFLTNMLTQQNRAYVVVDEVAEVQGNARAILDLVEREVRTTALMAPEGAAVCGIDNTAGPDTLYVTDGDAYDFSSETRYNLGASISSGFTGTGTGDTLQLSSVDVDDKPFYDLDADGNPDSDFRPGGGVIVVDRANPERGASCGVIAAGGVDTGTRRITVDFSAGAGGLSAHLPGTPAADLVAVPAHRFAVNAQLQLMRDDIALSGDVEDFQVSYFFDLNDDGLVGGNENPGAAGQPQYFPNAPWDNRDLKEIRFGFVVRSRLPDPKLPGAAFQALENRAPIAGTDGFRRRAFTAQVRPRNVGHRWNG